MVNVQADVREWLLSQADWLQETADRILKKGQLENADYMEICALLKTPGGREVTQHRAFDSLAELPNAGCELRLTGIGNVVGIENLSPRNPLNFGETNLVVVYGHNGSGKSGYTRILKKATGKARALPLKQNVFQATPSERKVQISYKVGTQSSPTSIDWQADSAPISEILAVDIFDSDEAVHYLSKESVASYTPKLVKLFDLLVAACDQLKPILEYEQKSLLKTLPALPLAYYGTATMQLYNGLTHATTDTQLKPLVEWTDVQELMLVETNERLKTKDPAADAKQKRVTKKQVDQVINALRLGVQIYGIDNIQVVRAFQQDAKSKRKIALEAAQVGSAKLEGVGSDTWRSLWNAAKAYSQVAYPNQAYPVLEDGLCVLCHQQMDLEAQQRLRDFESFVQSTIETQAQTADAAYRQQLAKLFVVPNQEQVVTQCQAAGIATDEWINFLTAFWNNAEVARSGLLVGETGGPVNPVSDISNSINLLQSYSDQLEATACQLDADALSFDREQQEKNKTNLEAAKWASQQSSLIKDEVARLKTHKDYDDWIGMVNPQKISVRAGKVAEQVITEAYVRRFNDELMALGARHLKVELIKTRTERGKALHKLCLKGIKQGQTQIILDSILSEGERRIVSLAAFMADVTGKVQITPFVFDDPISSLDQTWEESTIERLVSLSQSRQVIVFTHRLSMLGLLVDKADQITTIHIRQETWGAGEAGEVPLYGKKPEGALRVIKQNRVTQAKRELAEHGSEAYYPLAKAICSDIRIITERLVETVLLADVIQRHRRQVNTLGKIQHLAKIKISDCNLIEEVMGKYSRYEHSQSQESPVQLPQPDELDADVDKLLSWYGEFKDRPVA